MTAAPQAAESVVRHVETEVMPTASSNPLSTISTAIGAGLQIGIDTVAGLPLGLTAAAAAIAADPEANTANVLNFLLYSFLSPDPIVIPTPYGPQIVYSTFLQFGARVIFPLTSLLPEPVQVKVLEVFGEIGGLVRKGLAELPGNTVLGAYAIGAATIGLATEKPELYGALTHIQDTGEALGEKVFDLFSHGSGPEMMALRGNDAQETLAEDSGDSLKSGLPILGHILHPQITSEADEVEVEVEPKKPSKPQFGLLRGSLFAGEKSGPGSFLNGSRLGCDEEEAVELGNVGGSKESIDGGAHRLGLPGKLGVGDLVKKVLGGHHDDDSSDNTPSDAE
ncbi:hypothetical protein DVS77_13365 [Mycolicibacterium moriokaense]|nr:hypothetical protein DVS77_13365 [Mycolicibacterium moriokaense]